MRAVDHNVLPDTDTGSREPVRAAGRGRRDAEQTIQVSLRLPVSQVGALRELAFAAGREEKCMITPQEIMRRIIAAALKPDDLPG
jgi:hypothetical protein